MKINYYKLQEDVKELALQIDANKYEAVYGIPNGGILPAYMLAARLSIPLITEEELNQIDTFDTVLIVDDLIDTGQTLLKYKDYDIAVVYRKHSSPTGLAKYFAKEIPDEWVDLPHETKDTPIENNITRILQYIGENPKREGLMETPKRVAKSYESLFSGYTQNVADILTTFEKESYTGIILLKDIEFYSMCEHHMLPFYGKAHVAYVPSDKIVGISKLARVVEIFSRRLQNQERLTDQIANELQFALSARGVAVVMEAKHFCMMARGVQKQNSIMKTSSITGVFKNDAKARSEFFDLLK